VVRILDLFCGAGGAAMGLHYAFPEAEIVGVDIKPQPRYPFTFCQMEWADFMSGWGIDGYGTSFYLIWASPKCQNHSTMTKRWNRAHLHENQIPAVREVLISTGKPYIIENVPQAPLENPVTLCGSMFGLGVRRHRHFECSFPIIAPNCQHELQPEVVGVYGHAGGTSKRDGLTFKGTASWKEAMGIDWMTGNELAQAIPPAYSRYIAEQFKLICGRR
jgi:DNA (cytosine-5)-methyltransferase 1